MSLRNRIASVLAVALLASPALAADRDPDCTVCKDPTFPSLESIAPGIGLNMAPVKDSTGTPSEVSFAARLNRAPGVGVASGGTSGSVYADPTWPTVQQAPSGMAATTPAQPARSAPAKGVVVASR